MHGLELPPHAGEDAGHDHRTARWYVRAVRQHPHRTALLEARRLDGAVIVSGDASRDRFSVALVGDDVHIVGTLWDRAGPAVSFGKDALRFHTRVLADSAPLRDGYDGAWTRDRSR